MADEKLFTGIFEEIDNGTFKPQAPQRAENVMLSDAVDEVVSEIKLPQRSAVVEGKAADPEQYQKVKALADRVGLDAGFVARNFADLETQQKAIDLKQTVDNNPALGEWYASGDNPQAIKLDELRGLSGLSWLGAAAVDSFGGGMDQTEFGTLSTKVMRGVATPEEIARADELFTERQPRTYAADSWLQGAWVHGIEQLPVLGGYLGRSAVGFGVGFAGGAATGAGGALIAGQLGPQAATPEEIVTVPGAALAMGSVVGRAGAASAAYLYSFEQIAGPAYYEFKAMKDETGQPIDEDVARVAAYVTGAVGGGLEFIGTEKLASLIPGADKLTGIFTKDGVKAALTVPTVREAFKNFAVNIGSTGAIEITTEVGQQAVQIFAQEVAKQVSNSQDGTSFEPASADEIADSLMQAATQTAQAMTILGPALSGTRLGADLKRANAASRDQAIVRAVIDHAQNDELLKRLPEKAQEAVKAITANGPVQNVYVAPEAITTLFQSVEDIDTFVDTVGIRDQWEEASRLGHDIEIPIEVYYAKIAGTPMAEQLAQFSKLDPNSMSPYEADIFNEAWQAAQESLRADYEATLAGEQTALTGVEAIVDDVKQKAMDAGIVPDQAAQYAKLYGSFFRVMGERTGQDPQALYQSYGVDIKRALPVEGQYKPVDSLDLSLASIRSGRIPTIRKQIEKARGSSLLDRIKERGGIVDQGGELKALGLGKGKNKRVIRPSTDNQGDMVGGQLMDNQFSADDTARQLWEEGYFPEFQERPTANDLFDAIAEELGGNKRFSDRNRLTPDLEDLAGLVAFSETLDQLGLDPQSMDDQEIRAALDEATNRDPENAALYQFAGQGARTVDNAALARAMEMEAAGEFRDEIFDETGFFRGADGKWRFEISDQDAKIKTGVIGAIKRLTGSAFGYDGDLSGILQHDKLFAAYPNLKGFWTNITIDPKAEYGGSFEFAVNRIEVRARNEAEAKSVLLHEIAHAIQREEGFAGGGNTRMGELYEGENIERVRASIKNYENDLKEGYETNNTGLIEEAKSNIEGAQRALVRSAQYEYYRRIAGEVEARNVQERDKQRTEGKEVDAPWWTADVPADKVIVVITENTGDSFEAMEPTRELFQQEGQAEKAKRGSIQLSEGRTVINLFEAANLSTFLHESGHFFLEVFRDLAKPSAPPALLADWATVKEYLGLVGDGPIPVEAHEKFARTFEAYLFEGKAPSEEVAGIFARFRSWLIFVYRSVKSLNVPINDKIRGVMDRLVATEDEIANAQRTAVEFQPAFKSAAEAGMTDQQYAEYLALAGKAVDEARRQLQQRMLSDIARQTTEEWRSAKREIREEVSADLGRQTVYRALAYLRTGVWNETTRDGRPIPAPAERLFLDRKALLQLMGEGVLQRLPKSVPPIYRAEGGVHPDYLAELFGFASGTEMLTQMMSVPSFARAVAQEVDVRMKSRFGDLMGDANARAREAQAALTNEDAADLIIAEMEILGSKGLRPSSISRKDAQRIARQMIREKPIRSAVIQKVYQNANAKAAKEAERAIIAGDWKAAVAAKQRQLLNHFLALEARKAQQDVEQAINYLGRFTGRKRPSNVAPDYLDQIEALLERFDLRKSVSLKEAQRRASLAAWITEQEANGNLVQIPDTLRNDAFRKPYREMTVEDLIGLRDTVQNIEHLGKLKEKLLANKEAREFAVARDDLIAAVAAAEPEKAKDKTRNPTVGDRILSGVRSLEASMLKLEQIFAWFDGGDVNGPFNRMIWRPIAEAEARENDLQLKYSARFMEILGKLDKERLNERISIAGIDQTMLRSEVMAVALNLGNAGNFDKMKKAEVWTDADVERITSNLNAEEWQAVQEIWDTVNSLWPQIEALQKRLTGVTPPKVEARKVTTPFGELKGGYYPLIYDPNRSPDVEDRQSANADKLFENTYLRPETWHGFTKERSKGYARPLLFDLDAAGQHMISVIHDLTHREAIMDANKLLTNPEVRAAIEGRFGKELYRQFVPWLQSIAHDRVQNDGLSAMNAVFRGIRSRATIVGMGYRISTMLTQVVGYSSSAEMVPVKLLAGALKDFIRNPFRWNAEVNRLSGEMRYRSQNLDRDIRDQIRQLTGKEGLLDQARKFAFVGIGYMDRLVTVPTWMAAYQQHLKKYPADTQGAVAWADQVVRLTGGSGGAKDLPAVMRRNEGVKLVTMFYSYFSAYYNRQRNWGRDAKRAIQNGEYSDFPSLLARQVFMTVIPAVAADLIVGKGPDDDEGYAEWAAKKVAMYPLAAFPILRDAVSTLDSGFGYAYTPAARTVQEALIAPFQMFGKIIDGEGEAREIVKQTLETTGYALKLPTGQLSSSIDNVWKAIEDDDFQLRDLVVSRQR